MILQASSSNQHISQLNQSSETESSDSYPNSDDSLSHMEEGEKPEPRSEKSKSRRMISPGALTKKFLWCATFFALPVESGRKLVNVGEKFLRQSEGYAGVLGNKTHATVLIDSDVNNLVLNDPMIKQTEDRYAVSSKLHGRITESVNAGSTVENGGSPEQQELKSSVAQNLFERQMMYKYQRAVMYESHFATHMATYELSQYADQVEGLEETITELRIEAARHAERIEALEQQVTQVSDKLIELLNLSKAVHDLSKRACEVLKSIPIVKNIDFIENICAANDSLGVGIGKLENVQSGNPDRKLTSEDIDQLKVQWEEKWPRVQFWLDKLHEISANIDEHPDFVSPSLPEPEGGWKTHDQIEYANQLGGIIEEIYHLGNVTEVIETSLATADFLANEYVQGVDTLLHEESINLYEQLTGGTYDQTNPEERMAHLKKTLQGAAKEELQILDNTLVNVQKELKNKQSSINQRVYLYSALAIISGSFTLVQLSRLGSSTNNPLIGARTVFNDMYTAADYPSLAVNKVSATNMLRATLQQLQAWFSQLDLADELGSNLKNDKDGLSSVTWKTYAKVAGVSAIGSLPEFLFKGGFLAFVLSTLAANAMDGNYDILEKGDKDINQHLMDHGDKMLGHVEAIYEQNEKMALAADSLEADMLAMENKFIAHQEQLEGKIKGYNDDFILQHQEEYPWIGEAIGNPLLTSVIADRSKNRELEAEFAAFDITTKGNLTSATIFGNSTEFPDAESSEIPDANATLPPLGDGAQSPHDRARGHYDHGSERLGGKLDGLDAKVGDNFVNNLLLVAVVYFLFVSRKVDSQTTPAHVLGRNNQVQTTPTLGERLLPGVDERHEIRNLADLLTSLQLFFLRRRDTLPGFLMPIDKNKDHIV